MSSDSAQDRTRAFAEAALNGAPLGIAFVDTALRVSWVNDAFAALTGQSVEALAGCRLAELLPSSRPTVEDHLREVLQSGAPLLDLALTPPSGTALARHLRATIRPVHTDSGDVLGAVVTCSDVTDVRTLADQFLQSQKMEAVGLLANVIAHDFNNLLTVIQGYSELLLRNSADEIKRTKRLTDIHAAAEAAGHLSRQLLTLSRRNTGAVGPVDMNLLVRTVSRMLDRVLPANVAQDLALAEDLGLTLADPGQLDQVLMNLITNAIDAMPAGGLLTIETSNTVVTADGDGLPAGEYVTLTVTDTGEGMDAATQARIFEPRFTTKAADKGTGVGLAAVRTMVAALRGQLAFVSAPGKGSTFTVHLPRVPAPAANTGPDAIVPPGSRAATILIVEDHRELRESLITMLEEAGYQVIAAAAGGDALRAVAEHQGPIDLLLADVELPDASGTDLAERLRTARPGMRVLVSSGFGEQALSAADAARLDYAIIGKPFTMHDLLRTIQSILYPTSAAAPAVG